MTDDPRDDANRPEHVHGPEEGERPDDAVPYEEGEVGRRMNEPTILDEEMR